MRETMKMNVGDSYAVFPMFDTPIEKDGQYGKQWAYALKDTKSGKEFSLFAAENLHHLIQNFNIKKNTPFVISKKEGVSENGKTFSYFEVQCNGYTGNTTKGSQIIANGRPSPDFTPKATQSTADIPEFLRDSSSETEQPCCENPEEEKIFRIYENVCKRNDALPDDWKLSKPELQKIAVTLFLNK